MRTLKKNQTSLWLVNPVSKVDAVDEDGYETGESVTTYSTPVLVSLSLYPSNGAIVEEIFGKDYSCDMLACSNEINLSKFSLLFLSEPIENYPTTYDYKVDKINKSLNTFQYALRRRT